MIKLLKNIWEIEDEGYAKHVKIFRFLISGGLAAATDLTLLFLFTDILGFWYLLSSVIAFILSFFVSFSLQKLWTFRDHSKERVKKQLGIYLLIASFNIVINTLLVYLSVEYFSLHYLPAQIIVSAFIAIESFFVYQKFIFHKRYEEK